MSAGSTWRWGEVEASGSPNALRLTHLTEDVELWLRNSRLQRGRGYDAASVEARRALARVGAIVRLRERGRYFVHAAGAVDPLGRAVLLVGDSGDGKSTLAYALTRASWKMLGDDGVVLEVREAGIVAHAWRAPLLVSRDLAPAFPELATGPSPSRNDDPRRRVAVSVPHARQAPVAALFFVGRGPKMRLSRVTPVATLAGLVRQSPWVIIGDGGTRAHLAALSRVATAVPALRFEHTPADLLHVADVITQALTVS